MGNAVVAFIFPEPEDSAKKMGVVMAKAKEIFADMPDVRIYAAVREAADTISFFLTTGELPTEQLDEISGGDISESNLVRHARRELELIGEEPKIIEWYLTVIQAFADFGHSGGTAMVTIPTIHELLQFNNLSPLTNDPEEWIQHTEDVAGVEGGVWQSTRNSEAFSPDGGKHYYLLSEGGNFHNPHPLHTSASIE